MTDTINTRFARAWESVENPPLDSVNPHFKNKFASLGATLRVIRKACKSNGIAYLQAFDAMRTEDGMEAVIRTWVADGTGQRIDLSCMRFPITDNPQQLGSAMTYCRRYVAQLDWGILGEEDDDAERAMQKPGGDLAAAKKRLADACGTFAKRYGKTKKEIADGVTKRPDYEAHKGDAEWYDRVAEELLEG